MGTLFLLAAAYTVLGVGMGMSALEMTAMAQMRDMPSARVAGVWSLTYWLLVFLMSWAMMIAMMLPSVAPTVLLHAALRRRPGKPKAPANSAAFLGGYLVAWGAFSGLAAALQWGLEAAGVVSPSMMILIDSRAGAVMLILAGLYQFTALKTACLRHNRSPVDFLTRRRQRGAFVLGAEHGAICLGCCWALMALLFAGGTMNLWWICALLTLVVAEKHFPRGDLLAEGVGAGLMLWRLALLASTG